MRAIQPNPQQTAKPQAADGVSARAARLGRSKRGPHHRRATMAEVAVERLKDDILMGRLRPGEPLRLEQLARSLGMSISPIREAIRRLESFGYAEHVPHQGARVSRLTSDQLREIFEVRLALESLALRRAAARFDERDVSAAIASLGRLERAYERSDMLGILAGNRDFHFALYNASGATFLIRQIVHTWELCDRYRVALFPERTIEATRRVEAEGHRTLLDACARHDASLAVRQLKQHLARFGRLFEVTLAETDGELDVPSPAQVRDTETPARRAKW